MSMLTKEQVKKFAGGLPQQQMQARLLDGQTI